MEDRNMMYLHPKKSLGQHFLNSPRVLEQIVTAAEIKKGETVLEIGPGTGILTRALLDAGANVVAVEKDERACKILKSTEYFVPSIKKGSLVLVNDDVLKFDISSVLGTGNSILGTSFSIVANIPYYITGAILQKFLENEPRPDRMVLLVQKEVADRIAALTGKESILSISVKAFGTPRKLANVPRGAFTPSPSVDSAILVIADISDVRFIDAKVDIPRFFEVVRAGFAHKRKFLLRNLETLIDAKHLRTAWHNLNLNEKARAEDLTIEQWFSLVAQISRYIK